MSTSAHLSDCQKLSACHKLSRSVSSDEKSIFFMLHIFDIRLFIMYNNFVISFHLLMMSPSLHTPYSIELRKQYKNTLTLIIRGELDESNADEAFSELQHELSEKAHYDHISCDFSALSYTNSKTLGYLTDFIARTHRLGKTISFDRLHPKTQYIFDMVGLSRVVDSAR